MTIVNLNKARKSRARAKAKQTADENAVKFGRSRAEKSRDKADVEKTNRTLDGAKRET